jgi:O-methyltransferase domain/Dimerisation domain
MPAATAPASDVTASQADGLPPHVKLIEMGLASWVSRILYAAAKLGIADALADVPRTAFEIAGPMKAHAPTLHRLMRTLAGLGILTEDNGHRFALTSLGQALKTDAPGSARATLITLGGVGATAWAEILFSLETGRSGFEKATGLPLFAYLASHPEEAALFSETMVGIHGREPAAVAASYDFSIYNKIVDVGGATGNLIAAILAKHSRPEGILFDLPNGLIGASELLKERGVQDRVAIEPGDFFKSVPAGGDAYILSHIIHDFSEEQCVTILGNCRRAMASEGRVLIVEMVLPDGDTPHPGKVFDMMMLVLPGGQERTEDEYRDLLPKAGLRLSRILETGSDVSIVEAVAA